MLHIKFHEKRRVVLEKKIFELLLPYMYMGMAAILVM